MNDASLQFFDSSPLLEAYRRTIGRRREEIPTPALVLDVDAARRNLEVMAAALRGKTAHLRPHVKVEKSPHLARMHMEHGAVGVATATVWEAVVMALAGIPDVLVANQVVGRAKIEALMHAASLTRLTVAVDDPGNAAALSAAAGAAGVSLEVVIEVDVGMGRGGTRSLDETSQLAAEVSALPALELRGVQGYEGHCMLNPDLDLRVTEARAAMDLLAEHVERLTSEGHVIHDVTAGGTGTYNITGFNPMVTELQAGSFVFMDMFHGSLVSGFERSLTVDATVVIRHGSTVVLDAGRKSVSIDFIQPRMVGYDIDARYFAEEHALFDFPGDPPLAINDRVSLIPGYAPTTVNVYDAYHVVSDGVVVDVWPIVPRGPGQGLVPTLQTT